MNVLLAAFFALGVTTPTARKAPLSGDTANDPIIMAAAVRRACIWVNRQPMPRQHPLYTFCELPSPSTNRQDWESLVKANVPDPRTVQATAELLDESDWETQRKNVQGFEPADGGVAAAAAGGLPTTNTLLWGTSNFLVARAQEQLSFYVVSRIGQRLCTPQSAGPLLVSTCVLLRPSADGTSASIPGATALREAARHDLHQLTGTATSLAIKAQKDWPQPALADAAHVVRLSGYFVGALLDGSDAERAFLSLGRLSPVDGASIPFSEVKTPAAVNIQMMSALLMTIESDSSTRVANWPDAMPGAKLQRLYATKALLVNMLHGVPFAWSREPIPDKFCEPGKTPLPCVTLFSVARRATVVDTRIDTLRVRALRFAAASADSARILTAASLLSGTNDLLVTLAGIGGDKPGFAIVSLSISGVADVTNHLVVKNYSAAVRRALVLVDTLGLGGHLPKEGARVLSLVTDIAESDDAKGIESALEHFVGRTTYMNKRTSGSGWHLFVQAYAGGAYGKEDACAGSNTCGVTSTFAGAYVPIGVELGHEVNWRGASWLVRSVGVFAQAIDLGTLASWRLSNEANVESAPNVSGRQVLAPGGHVVFGLRALPLSIGIGRSVAPKLRRITTGAGTEDRNAVRKLSLFAAVDIPLFP